MTTDPRCRPRPRPRTWLVRRLGALLALTLAAVLPALSPSPAQAADDWIVGVSKQSQIRNCLLLAQGITHFEAGVNVVTAYHGTLGTSPKVGQASYMTTVVTRLGTHCSTPIAFPKFVLPSGVVFNTSEPIECYYKPPTGQQSRVTHALECPQWSAVGADGRYTSGQTGWSGGWPMPSNSNWDNGAQWEFVVPIKATTVQNGSKIRSQVDLADGNDSPTLTSEVTFHAPAGSTATVPGAPTHISTTATSSSSARVSFTAPASNGGAAITSYESRCTSTNGGAAGTATSTGSPATVTGLSAGKQYRCQVRARNQAGWGAWSAYSASFTPSAGPDLQTQIAAAEKVVAADKLAIANVVARYQLLKTEIKKARTLYAATIVAWQKAKRDYARFKGAKRAAALRRVSVHVKNASILKQRVVIWIGQSAVLVQKSTTFQAKLVKDQAMLDDLLEQAQG